MRLTRSTGPLPPANTFPEALRQAVTERGHAPAVTVVARHGRSEQGMASLAQWTAKGAHLLQDELALPPGALVALHAPPSWTTAVVCMASWWSGLRIHLVDGRDVPGRQQPDPDLPDDAAAVVRWEDGAASTDDDDQRTWWVGATFDGTPRDPGLAAWTVQAQWMPDALPAPRADDGPALSHRGHAWTMSELMERARQLPPGTLGIDGTSASNVDAIIAVAVRPVVTGYPTVVLDGVDRAATTGDRIAFWADSPTADPST